MEYFQGSSRVSIRIKKKKKRFKNHKDLLRGTEKKNINLHYIQCGL